MDPIDSENQPIRRFIVKGRVQGVWFRDSTRREAERLGIDGYAKNLDDGDVEVLVTGSAEAIIELEDWLQHGPRLAKVSSVREVESGVTSVQQGFEVL